MTILLSILDMLKTAVVLMVVLTVLVAVHEYGHFIVARMFGMEVTHFAVMVGGVRRTDLRPYLSKPLAPSSLVWGIGSACLALVILGAVLNVEVMVAVGFFGLAVPIPFWVATRIAALYHLPILEAVKHVGGGWLGGLVVLFLGAKAQGFGNWSLLLGVLLGGALIGLMVIYYRPVLDKEEEADFGKGRLPLVIDGEAKMTPVEFGPVAETVDKKGTKFWLLLLPLGGFASTKGMHLKVDGSEIYVDGGFFSKPAWQRFLMYFAGPVFSIVFGILLLTGLFVIRGKEVPDMSPKIGSLSTDGAAYTAGVRVGDVVKTIDGRTIESFFDIVNDVRSRLKKVGDKYEPLPFEIVVDRGGELKTFNVTPIVDKEPTPVLDNKLEPTLDEKYQAKLSIGPSVVHLKLNALQSIQEATVLPFTMASRMLAIFSRPDKLSKNVGGPVSMAQATNAASKNGILDIIALAGLLSISLGITNLLPTPPLDGGHMVLNFVEMLRGGRRLSLKTQNTLSMIGVIFILLLMVTAFTADVGRVAANKQKPKTEATQPQK